MERQQSAHNSDTSLLRELIKTNEKAIEETRNMIDKVEDRQGKIISERWTQINKVEENIKVKLDKIDESLLNRISAWMFFLFTFLTGAIGWLIRGLQIVN